VSASFPTLSPSQCVDTHADSFLRPQHNWRCYRSCCRCGNPHTDCGAQADLHIQGTTQAVHVCLHWIWLDMHACTDQPVSSQGFPPTEKKPETHKQALKPNQPNTENKTNPNAPKHTHRETRTENAATSTPRQKDRGTGPQAATVTNLTKTNNTDPALHLKYMHNAQCTMHPECAATWHHVLRRVQHVTVCIQQASDQEQHGPWVQWMGATRAAQLPMHAETRGLSLLTTVMSCVYSAVTANCARQRHNLALAVLLLQSDCHGCPTPWRM
jgi:hypothetical protein